MSSPTQRPKGFGKTSVLACLTLLTLLLSLPQNAGAARYTFKKIADSRDGVFSGFSGSRPSINNNGTVAFVGELVSGEAGVFTSSGGPLTTIADTIDHPEFGGFENPSINDNGVVAFIPRDLVGGAVGIFKASGGALTQISDASVGIGVPSINNAGTVAFAGAGLAVFTGSGGPLTTIADTSDDLFGFRDASIDNTGTVGFFAEAAAGTTFPSGGTQGIFTGDATGISILIDNSGSIISFGPPVAFNDVGMAVFEATLTLGEPRSIVTSDGTTTTVIVDGSGPLSDFGFRSINNAGAIAFDARPAGFQGTGTFTGPDPLADKVISDGDLLFGRRVVTTAISLNSLNDSGQIAFWTLFDDGTSGIFRADPIPEGPRYAFSRIADTSGPIIGFSAPSISARGTVAFKADLAAGRRTILSGNGGPLTTIADTADGIFSEFSIDVRINARDTVVFRADLAAGGRGIFIGNGGPPMTIADTAGGVFSDLFGVSINPSEMVAFHGALVAGGTGTFTSNGVTLTTIADTSGIFSLFGTPSINPRGTVAFLAGFDSGGVGLFTGNGGPLTTITDSNSGPFNFLSSPLINAGGIVVFMAGFPPDDSGIFIGNGESVTTIADTTGGIFSSFGPRPSINARGAVAFIASLTTGELGIFTGPDPVADKVITTGDSLDESFVTFVSTFHQSLNDRGQIAFSAALTDGRQGIYIATPMGAGIDGD
jgi:hypothetical protein